MNYKTFVLWVVGGLFAYFSGRSGNIGVEAYFGILAGFFLILGLWKITKCDEEKCNVTVNVKVNTDQRTSDKKFKIGDTVKVIKSSCIIDEGYVGKIGKITKKATAFDWYVDLDNGQISEPLDEYQLELASPIIPDRTTATKKRKNRRSTVTMIGMTPKQKRSIYNARWVAKKKMSK